MNKKTFAIIGVVGGAILIFLGILVMSGALGGDTSYASGSSYLYDSGYASFGADFYTYVSNNAAEAASAARTTAENLRGIAELLKNVGGIFLMGFGLFMVCFFGMSLVGCAEKAPKPEKSEAAPAEAPVPAEQPEPAEEAETGAENPEPAAADPTEAAPAAEAQETPAE